MRASKEDEVMVWMGQKSYTFKYSINVQVNWTHIEYLQTNFGGYGCDYYYETGTIWFRKASHVTHFLLTFG